jgi:hypothetical protein
VNGAEEEAMAQWHALPRPIRLYLETEGIVGKRLVYLLVDGRGVVRDWGGDVAMLGPRRIEIGQQATKQLVGLFGLLPASGKPTQIPHFEMEAGLTVHLHVLRTRIGDAVVMVDAAAEQEPKRKRQQSRRDQKLASRARGKSSKS